MKRVSSILMGLALLVVCSVTPAVYANVILAEELWDAGTVGSPTWGEDQSYVTTTHSDGSGEGYLDIEYDPSRGAGAAETVVYTDASAFFAGNWQEVSEDGGWIEFDFWADENIPYYFELRFEGTSGDVWRYDLSTAGLGSGWTDFNASLAWNESLWYYGEFGGSEATFLSDLANIDWIGIYIFDDDTDANNYGLDNFQLMVPEPAEYALAFSALAVTWLSIRRKRKKASDQAA
ncbi:MAG: hypothetical protein ISS31_11120 [Kiritimatiellae bacterium]|nr:hypothetical protein [Kiritimatiellia bacterium]